MRAPADCETRAAAGRRWFSFVRRNDHEPAPRPIPSAGLFPEGLAGARPSEKHAASPPAASPSGPAAAAAPAQPGGAPRGQHHPPHPVTIHVAEERLEWLFPNFDCCAPNLRLSAAFCPVICPR